MMKKKKKPIQLRLTRVSCQLFSVLSLDHHVVAEGDDGQGEVDRGKLGVVAVDVMVLFLVEFVTNQSSFALVEQV